MMRKSNHKLYVSALLVVGVLTGINGGTHSFYEGHIAKVDLTKKLSGHEGQWTKEKKVK